MPGVGAASVREGQASSSREPKTSSVTAGLALLEDEAAYGQVLCERWRAIELGCRIRATIRTPWPSVWD
jgi:hypothetical protein